MLEALRKRDMPASELAQPFRMSQPTISEHLRTLRVAGLIGYRSRGNQHMYSLIRPRLRSLKEWIRLFDEA